MAKDRPFNRIASTLHFIVTDPQPAFLTSIAQPSTWKVPAHFSSFPLLPNNNEGEFIRRPLRPSSEHILIVRAARTRRMPRAALPTFSPHHGRPMMVDEIPSTLDAFIQIGREDLTFLRRLALQAGDILHANNPPHIPRHLH